VKPETIAPALPRQLRKRLRLVDATIDRVGDGVEPVAIERDGPPPTARSMRGLDLSVREHLEEAWRRLGHDTRRDPGVRELVAAGIAPVAGGMPTGVSGLGFQHNLPAPGTFIEDSDAFFANTERNDIPGNVVQFPGLGGGGVDVRIPQVGLLANIRIRANLTLVVSGTGAVTTTYQWPWNVIKRLSLNVNGQTGIISAEGLDIRARRQRVYRNPKEAISTAPNTDTTQIGTLYAVGDSQPGTLANGTYAVQLLYELPITHDDYNLIGALYAQSDSNAFFWRFDPAAQTELFTIAAGGAVALTGSLDWTYTIYDIPEGDSAQGRRVLLPNMSWLHGFLGYNQPFANTGEVQIALIRTAGQLLALYGYMDNGGAAVIDPTALSEIRFQYGGNRRPRVFAPVAMLMEKNVHDYNGRVMRPAGYYVLDYEVDNPVRDLVYPKGVTELAVVAIIPVGTTLNANAHAHVVEETMFPGR
jgi:hypothetical protein